MEEDLKTYYSYEFTNRQNLTHSTEKDMDMLASFAFSSALLATAGLAMVINPITAGAVIGILLASNRWLNH